MIKFPCLVCQKAVGTNYNSVCCDMCDRWVQIYCKNIYSKTDRNLKKYLTSLFCKSCFQKEIPFSSLNGKEFVQLPNTHCVKFRKVFSPNTGE